ncbi:MAG: NAD(P)/FAD-dependent oxidoreductase [Aquiluna sp.]|nr:NAD(P)/FAD-dependent oxidoreductase [Aquiluna sp.]MCF8545777.1 NAD(P)/FAD-dependent oxidoreductase [Aquiluna sp.]
MTKKVAVLGAGLSGLASAALLAKAGHEVTVFEANDWLGGKSRRIELLGQRMDTGPALVTFPKVLEELEARYNNTGKKTAESLNLELEKLSEVGRYYFRGSEVILPIPKGHHLYPSWERFISEHAPLSEAIKDLLLADPADPKTLPAVLSLTKRYGLNLSTKKYLDSLSWMEEELKELISIHTLNAGIAPEDTFALYASITAVMASEGIAVPKGGVNEIALAIARLATAAGANIQLGTEVTRVSRKTVETKTGSHEFDYIVSSLDPKVLKRLRTNKQSPWKKRSCSGVAIYAVLSKPLPENTVTHSVVMPDSPVDLHRSLQKSQPPIQTMAFVNYYLPGQIYPNTKPTVAVLLTAPADGLTHEITSPWVRSELDRISKVMGLAEPIDSYFADSMVLNPSYFALRGASGGALYGETRKLWQAGPFHFPQYNNPLRPWLWQVGAAVHPGGGIPAVLGGAMIAMNRLLKKLGS